MTTKSTKLYVGNLSDKCKVEQLRALFSDFGRVEECDIVKNYGFVHMSTDEETKIAIQELNGYEFMGNRLLVEVSISKVRPKPGMGGKGQCYRCGKSGHWSKECPRNIQDRVRGSIRPIRTTQHYNRNNRFNPTRDYSGDRCERLQYFRDYIDPYDRRFIPNPYDRRLPPDYYRRLLPEEFEHFYERRSRERFEPYFDRTYSPYPSYMRRLEPIY